MRVRLKDHRWLIAEIVDAAIDRARKVISPYFFSTEDMMPSVRKDARKAVQDVLMEYGVRSDINTDDKSMCSALAIVIQVNFFTRKREIRKELEQLSFWSVPRYRVFTYGTFNVEAGKLNAALQSYDLTAEGDQARVIAETMRI